MKWTEFAVREARQTLEDWERKVGHLTPPIAVEDIADLLYALAIDVRQDLPENVAGRLYAEDQIIEVKSSDIPTRQRFTIAHEIGHFRLHTVAERWLHGVHVCNNEAIGVSQDQRQDPAPIPGLDLPGSELQPAISKRRDAHRLEIEANRFAAELLMPASLIETAISAYGADVPSLADLFNVSRQAMQIRLETLLYLPPPGPQISLLTDF